MSEETGAEVAGIAIEAEQAADAPESVDALRSALKAERDARRKFEREYKQASSRLSEFENANRSDLEKLIAERDQLRELTTRQQAQLRATVVEASVREAAEAAGARNVKAVWKLVKDDLVIDEETGAVANLADVIAAVRSEAPEMFGAAGGKSDAGRTGAAPTATTMTDLIRQRAGFD